MGIKHLPASLGHSINWWRVLRHLLDLWDRFWLKQRAFPQDRSPLSSGSIFFMFLKGFWSWSSLLTLKIVVFLFIAYFKPWPVVYMYPYQISNPHRLFPIQFPFWFLSYKYRTLACMFSSSIIICLLVFLLFSIIATSPPCLLPSSEETPHIPGKVLLHLCLLLSRTCTTLSSCLSTSSEGMLGDAKEILSLLIRFTSPETIHC